MQGLPSFWDLIGHNGVSGLALHAGSRLRSNNDVDVIFAQMTISLR
jgi:hypothetical protein